MAHQSTSNSTSSSSSAPMPTVNGASNSQNRAQQNASVGPPQDPRGGLYAPNLSGGALPDDSIAGIVGRLMSPSWPFYNSDGQTVTLTINWAVGIAGQERFERQSDQGRYVLSRGDELYDQGEAVGLSSEILDWLKGEGKTLTLPVAHFE